LPNNENGDKLEDDVLIDIEEDKTQDEELSKSGLEMLSEKIKTENPNDKNKSSSMNELENVGDDEYCVDGEIVLTHTVERGMDTMFHTIDFKEDGDAYSAETIDHKENIKNQLDKWFKV